MSPYDGIGEIDVEDMLIELGLENVGKVGAGEVQFSCPYMQGHALGDMHPSAHMHSVKLVYRCKGCGRAGTALELVAVVKRITPVEALRWLRTRYGDEYRPLQGSASAEIEKMMLKWSERRTQLRFILPSDEETVGERGIFYMDWESDHDAAIYMRGRGFDPALLARWQVGFDSWTRRVAIPVRAADGVLVGFKGRSIERDPEVRYMLLGDTDERQPRYGVGYGFSMHDPTNVVFGLHAAAGRRLVLCEGELDAIALHGAGIENAAATGTTTITKVQQKLLRWYADEIILFYDTDDAGRAATWGHYDEVKDIWRPGVVDKLSPYMRVFIVDEHAGDPASMDPELARDLVDSAKSWLSIATA